MKRKQSFVLLNWIIIILLSSRMLACGGGNNIVEDVNIEATSDTVMPTSSSNNAPPVSNAGSDISGGMMRSITLDGSASIDSDTGQSLQYLWTKLSGPSVNMSTNTNETLIFTPMKNGIYLFNLTVTDPHGLTSTDEVKVIIRRFNRDDVNRHISSRK